MVKRNLHLAKLQSGYLFPEITKRKKAFLEKNPSAELISLGIGDTTQPIPSLIANSMAITAEALATPDGYSGYGPEQGHFNLRQAISEQVYQGKRPADDIFVSDGSKCDIGRLQILFGGQASIAVQDPSYPAYVDTGVIMGQTSTYHPLSKQYSGITYMPCTPENSFFPSLEKLPRTDLIFFCSPNNPTGAAATYEQLSQLVDFAKQNGSVLIFDAAYACFIRNPNTPRSIYEIEGAEEVAIELGSFSKMTGFTGVRLAWSVVPKELRFEDGHLVQNDWNRINSTFFNGASNIAQSGGLAALRPEGLKAIKELTTFYMENATMLKEMFEALGYIVYGGVDTPYIWVHFPNQSSWEAFEMLLEKSHIISTPGSGFGPAGEGFLRFSAFANRANIIEAISRLRRALHKLDRV
ncbi:L,L-diaminopimelate aminotransferase [Candidatus Protochlamydia naegleriophila]|uniref:LL-diaminopimelate aminotransferase n=1 Tax=Candidatus Protochlamydia naegleriophila TaxID=389348 RepID=A0A0U5JH46_9BACT|nr:LL-diaminopimelate aminotransferase [Candidatus Protochlamydia naegleriophila]CUI17110.1 L,L-diaminopimelate aminotransferase [Candidatus Protochlamydia naegleriophila]